MLKILIIKNFIVMFKNILKYYRSLVKILTLGKARSKHDQNEVSEPILSSQLAFGQSEALDLGFAIRRHEGFMRGLETWSVRVWYDRELIWDNTKSPRYKTVPKRNNG